MYEYQKAVVHQVKSKTLNLNQPEKQQYKLMPYYRIYKDGKCVDYFLLLKNARKFYHPLRRKI